MPSIKESQQVGGGGGFSTEPWPKRYGRVRNATEEARAKRFVILFIFSLVGISLLLIILIIGLLCGLNRCIAP